MFARNVPFFATGTPSYLPHADIVVLQPLTSKEEITELVKLIAELNEIDVTNTIDDYVSKLQRKRKVIESNRALLQEISTLLFKQKRLPFDSCSLLDTNVTLKSLYDETEQKLLLEGGFDNLSRVFFDPLEYYLVAKGFDTKKSLLRRDYQAFIDTTSSKAYFFLFNDKSKVADRIGTFIDEKNCEKFVIFATPNMELSYAELNYPDVDIKIIEYDPKKLFILLNMFRWNFDQQTSISKIIDDLTQAVFE